MQGGVHCSQYVDIMIKKIVCGLKRKKLPMFLKLLLTLFEPAVCLFEDAIFVPLFSLCRWASVFLDFWIRKCTIIADKIKINISGINQPMKYTTN